MHEWFWFTGLRRWITARSNFISLPRDKQTAVLKFLHRQCRLTEEESFTGHILNRYSFLVEYVDEDAPRILVQPTRVDRVRFSICILFVQHNPIFLGLCFLKLLNVHFKLAKCMRFIKLNKWLGRNCGLKLGNVECWKCLLKVYFYHFKHDQ